MTASSLEGALFSFGLVLIAMGVTRWWKIDVQKDMAIGSVRAFLQLIAVGYFLQYLFGQSSIWLTLIMLLIMLTVGAWVAADSSGDGRAGFTLCFTSMFVGTTITLGLLLIAGIITTEARYLIPLAGMIVSNAMNASALTLNRLNFDLKSNRVAIETGLSLGMTWRIASQPYQKQATIAGMVSILNFLKTVGIVALPGAMTGMILAGAEPLDAVYLQIVVAYMLVSAVTITSIVTLELAIRRVFTPQHQLRTTFGSKL